VALRTQYDQRAVSWAAVPGDNTIEGSALMRTSGGEVRTCAALEAAILPVSAYASERMVHLYGNATGGYRPIWHQVVFEPDSDAFYRSVRTTKCDAQGEFSFDGLPDGDWFVQAAVIWEAAGAGTQGGSLMQRVQLRGGETQKVVLTQ
jgi:hypothetical protein